MARKIIRTAQGPAEYTTPGGEKVTICRCGLTTNEFGLCDGSHKQTLDEKDGEMYMYEADEAGCCGGGCCS